MQHSRSLTSGPIGPQLLYLAIPLLLGNIFQQLYNFAAAIIVGRYVGETAFAAIGVGGTVMNLFIFILTGCSIGVSIIIASLFGKGDYHELRKECFLALVFGGAFTILVSSLSIYFLPSVLRAIHTPAEIFGDTSEYLRIILGGLLATFYYNLGASALRAVGNTRYALVFLVIAVILNAGLTFVLVAWFGFGIAGAAWATVFSQGLSAVLCMVYILKKLPFMVPTMEDMKYDWALLKKTALFASLSAMHQSSLYLGKFLVQGAVNLLGTASIAAYTATGRIEGFSLAVGESSSDAVSVFVAQNTGAGDGDRARKGFLTGVASLVCLSFFVSSLLYLTAEQGVAIFVGAGQKEAVRQGVEYMQYLAFFYIFSYIGSCYVGFYRGTGRINVPFIGTTIQISVRVVLSYILAPVLGLKAVSLATGLGWMAIVTFQTTLYRIIRRRERREMLKEDSISAA